MNREQLRDFIKQHKLGVLSSVSADNKPGSALMGFAVASNLELIFDTVKTSRKFKNLLQNPTVAVVIGWDNETTVQYEGVGEELKGGEADHYKEIYFEVYPDGRERAKTWPDIVHFKITPTWIRYSNYNELAVIEEMRF